MSLKLKDQIEDTEVEIEIESAQLNFKFFDEEEGKWEILIIKDSKKLWWFLTRYFEDYQPKKL